MALSDKDREYINKIRKSIEKNDKRDMGFNTIKSFGQDAGFKIFDTMEESEEVRNENTSPVMHSNDLPSADIFDDDMSPMTTRKPERNKPANRKFDNTTSIADDDAISYDESMLGFNVNDVDIFDDANAPLVSSSTPVPPEPDYDGKISSDDRIGSGISNDDTVKAGELLDSLKRAVDDYGRSPAMVISIDGTDMPIKSIEISNDRSVIRINGTLDE